MDEKISVVIPVYNVEKYLDRCMRSVSDQTFSNLEIIIVNDGSTDSSLDICKKWHEKDSRVILVDKKNGGLSDARNAGIEIATGKYLFFVDSDDFIDVRSIELLYRNAVKYKADISIASFLRVADVLEEAPTISLSEKISVYSRRDAMYALFDDSTKMDFTVAWGKLYKRELFDAIRYPFGRKYEDSSIAHLIYDRTECVVYNKTPLYFYSYRAGSITTSSTCRDTDAVYASRDRMRFFETWGADDLRNKSIQQYITCTMGVYARYDQSTEEGKAVKGDMFDSIRNAFGKMKTEKVHSSLMFRIRTAFFLEAPGMYRGVIQTISFYRRIRMRIRVRR